MNVTITGVTLRNGAAHIDAVEIDPVINERGREDHPDRVANLGCLLVGVAA